MDPRRLIASIGAVCVFVSIGSAVPLPYSGGYPSAAEPVITMIPDDITSGEEILASTTSVPEGAVVVSDEENTIENGIRSPLALRDPSTYTDEDLHLIAQRSVDNQLTMAEVGAIKEGMTDEQIEKVQTYIRLYRGLDSSSDEEQ